jgi:hypothetical protein
MRKQIAIGFVALTLATTVYFVFPPASNAQAPKTETLEQKVVRLENEVRELRREVARLKIKRSENVIRIPAARPLFNGQKPQPGTPFVFNGETYYLVPLNENRNGANTRTATASPTVTLLASPSK